MSHNPSILEQHAVAIPCVAESLISDLSEIEIEQLRQWLGSVSLDEFSCWCRKNQRVIAIYATLPRKRRLGERAWNVPGFRSKLVFAALCLLQGARCLLLRSDMVFRECILASRPEAIRQAMDIVEREIPQRFFRWPYPAPDPIERWYVPCSKS